MGWTKGIPAKSGWYFIRIEGEEFIAEGIIVWVGHNASGVRHEGKFFYADHKWLRCREYLGPISPSDFEQLTRLRETGRNAMRTIQTLVAVLDSKTQRGMAEDADRVAAALNEALAQRHTGEKS